LRKKVEKPLKTAKSPDSSHSGGAELIFPANGCCNAAAPVALDEPLKHPEGIESYSPALADEIGLRWVRKQK
jgi:hypothetical protein